MILSWPIQLTVKVPKSLEASIASNITLEQVRFYTVHLHFGLGLSKGVTYGKIQGMISNAHTLGEESLPFSP